MYSKYASVILDLALDKVLDYGIPESLLPTLRRGMRVEIPVKGKMQAGYVFAVKETSTVPRIKPIHALLSEQPVLTDPLFELAQWLSRYYCTPLSKVLKTMLPASIRKAAKSKEQLFVRRKQSKEALKEHCASIRTRYPGQAAVLDVMLQTKKGILLSELLEQTGGTRSPVDTLVNKGCLLLERVRLSGSPLIGEDYFLTQAKKLNPEQKQALSLIEKDLDEGKFEVHLLHGVTGSGKTEIYLQSIERALTKNKGAIMLVPEISLTQQTIERFRARFKEKIAVLHHRLSHGERFNAWQEILSGKASIVIGARSAVFSPLPSLGLIIVDEEHEASYKQTDEAPCYNARDVAVMRGKMSSCPVILGSATPSLESYFNAENGKYHLTTLHRRAGSDQIPHVTIVDMQREFERAKGFTSFSELLLNGIKQRHAVGEQTILFLNRRGYHTTLFCQGCRTGIGCPHCDQTLTFHLDENRLACHLCGFTLSPPPRECPKCKNPQLMKYKGVGTELLERSLKAVLPEIRTLRIDGDTTRHQGSHQQLLRQFGSGKADVLIGTQMIAKGLHFPEVTLVGVINCDPSLNISDFRASEAVFQLIIQVAGRAGRGTVPGEVILQTSMPNNRTIQLAANQDYLTFYKEELSIRQTFRFPPSVQMIKVNFSSSNESKARDFAERFRSAVLNGLPSDAHVHPVVPGGHAKVKNRWRFQFLILGQSIYPMTRAVELAKEKIGSSSSVRTLVDVNPLSTF